MLNATTTHALPLKQLVSVLKDLVVDCVIHCKPEGLFLQAMDASHVAMCTFQLDASGFESYQCDTEFDIGLNMPSLERILRGAKKDDSLSLHAEMEGTVLEIRCSNTNTSKVSTYELKLMCIDSNQLSLGDIEYTTNIRMHSGSFSEVCRDMQLLGDTCLIASSPTAVSFAVQGDIGNGQTTLQHHSSYCETDSMKDTVSIDTSVSCELTFSLKYLAVFAKAMPLATTVELSLQEDAPLEVKYIIQNTGRVCFYVAPKITEYTTHY